MNTGIGDIQNTTATIADRKAPAPSQRFPPCIRGGWIRRSRSSTRAFTSCTPIRGHQANNAVTSKTNVPAVNSGLMRGTISSSKGK